jgi:hypothetical protein
MLKKTLLTLLALLIAGDAVILHGRYRTKMESKAAAVEYEVLEQEWSTPLVEKKR